MFDITRKPAEQSDKNNKYENLGFTRNPFPVNPSVKFNSEDNRENGSIFYEKLRETEINNFKTLINGSNSIILLMDYAAYRGRGNGKTAFLSFQRKVVNEDLGHKLTDGRKVLFLVYVAPGGEKKERKSWQLARLFFNSIIEQDILLMTFCRLRALTNMIPSKTLSKVNSNNLMETLGNDDWLAREFDVDGAHRIRDINSAVTKLLQQKGSAIDLRKKDLIENSYLYFKKLICNDESDYFWRSNGNKLVFDDLVKIFISAEFSNCIFLFDEAEKIITAQNSNERREFADNMRFNFIDGNVSNTAYSFYKIIMTIHPYSQELLLPHWKSAGLERFAELGTEQANDNTLFFHPIEKEDLALPLAEAYISKSRIEEWSEDSFYPFEANALKYAFLKSDKIPGKYLKLLFKLIERAVSDGWTKISNKEIEIIIDAEKFQTSDNDDSHRSKLTDSETRLDD